MVLAREITQVDRTIAVELACCEGEHSEVVQALLRVLRDGTPKQADKLQELVQCEVSLLPAAEVVPIVELAELRKPHVSFNKAAQL